MGFPLPSLLSEYRELRLACGVCCFRYVNPLACPQITGKAWQGKTRRNTAKARHGEAEAIRSTEVKLGKVKRAETI